MFYHIFSKMMENYENPVTVLENSKWRIQYGGPNIEDLIICLWKKYFRILCKICDKKCI